MCTDSQDISDFFLEAEQEIAEQKRNNLALRFKKVKLQDDNASNKSTVSQSRKFQLKSKVFTQPRAFKPMKKAHMRASFFQALRNIKKFKHKKPYWGERSQLNSVPYSRFFKRNAYFKRFRRKFYLQWYRTPKSFYKFWQLSKVGGTKTPARFNSRAIYPGKYYYSRKLRYKVFTYKIRRSFKFIPLIQRQFYNRIRKRQVLSIRPLRNVIPYFIRRIHHKRRRRKLKKINLHKVRFSHSAYQRAKSVSRCKRVGILPKFSKYNRRLYNWLRKSPRYSKRRVPSSFFKPSFAYLHLTKTKNNVFYSFVSNKGQLLSSFSNGRTIFKGPRRLSTVAGESVAKMVLPSLRATKITSLFIVLRSAFSYLFRPAIRLFRLSNINIAGIRYIRCKAHSLGLRPRSSRRV
jgi:ribosomal protein S11